MEAAVQGHSGTLAHADVVSPAASSRVGHTSELHPDSAAARVSALAKHGENTPFVRNALEFVLATILESKV